MRKSMLVVAVLMLAVLIGYANQGGAAEKLMRTSIATGGSGGVFFITGAGMSKVLRDYTNIRSVAESTGASVENARLVGTKATDFALCIGDTTYFAYQGLKAFEGRAFKNLRSMFGGPSANVHTVVPYDSPIKSIYDFKGKRIAIGPVGGSTYLVAFDFFKLYGITDKDFVPKYFGLTTMTDAMRDGAIDGLWIFCGFPAVGFSELSRVMKVRYLDLPKDKIEEFSKIYPMYVPGVIPGGTYKWVDKDVKSFGVRNLMITHKDVPEDFVYTMTKTILEHSSELGEIHPQAGEYNFSNALYAQKVIPLHPGAERYLREKGLLK